jgi:hypothetical protein
MKKLSLILIAAICGNAYAGGWTARATVSHIEIIRGQGFQINGAFGNPSECTQPNAVFVAVAHPQYDQLLSLAMTAFMGEKKLQMYSHECVEYGWHGGSYNELKSYGAMYLRH